MHSMRHKKTFLVLPYHAECIPRAMFGILVGRLYSGKKKKKKSTKTNKLLSLHTDLSGQQFVQAFGQE